MIFALHGLAFLIPLGLSFIATLGSAYISYQSRQNKSNLYKIIPIIILAFLFLWAIFLALAWRIPIDWSFVWLFLFLLPALLMGIFVGIAINYSINLRIPNIDLRLSKQNDSIFVILFFCWFFLFTATWWIEIIFNIAALPID